MAKGEHGDKVNPQEVPPEVLQHAETSSVEVKWVLRPDGVKVEKLLTYFKVWLNQKVSKQNSASRHLRFSKFFLVTRRLSSSESHHRGPPHFPSVLLQRGPQYPFQPFELTYLRSVVGGIRGTELNQPVDLPEVSEEQRVEALKINKGLVEHGGTTWND